MNSMAIGAVFRDCIGPIMVIDARVVCVKSTGSNLSIGGMLYPSIDGTLVWKDIDPDLKSAAELDGNGS
jgi:hypothetical protein